MEEAERFTRLLPIRMALNILPESSVILITILARLFPSSANERIRIRLTVVSDVSADEKNAESASKIIKTILWVTTLESNCFSLLLKLKINSIFNITYFLRICKSSLNLEED